jgi:tRNA(Leu) C34 or U34 (ribose-2'-O)-methylase TrmL
MLGIILNNPKYWENVGGVLRLAHNYNADFVVVGGRRYKKMCSDTTSAHRHIPVYHNVEDLHSFVPYDCVPIAIEILEGATPLPKFNHPQKAVYIFGPEDGSVSKGVLEWCKYKVYVPTNHCMNLASTVAVVMYDRMAKLS